MADSFEGIYFVKSGVVAEHVGESMCSRSIGEVLGLKSLISYLNNLISSTDVSESSLESVNYRTSASALKESRVVFFDKASLVQMAFSNENYFDFLYKLYYQHFVLRSNVSNRTSSDDQRHQGTEYSQNKILQTEPNLRTASR